MHESMPGKKFYHTPPPLHRSSPLISFFASVSLIVALIKFPPSFLQQTTRSMSTKKTWKVFWDLQCPYSKKNWERFSAIQSKFATEYDFSIHLTSLLFHPQAFTAQCAATLVKETKGPEAWRTYVDACFEQQDSFMNAAVGDARKSEIDAIFAGIAETSGVLDADNFTKDFFLTNLHDWELAIKPAWTEHKEALALGVVGTPESVIDGVLIDDSESDWGPEEWAKKLGK